MMLWAMPIVVLDMLFGRLDMLRPEGMMVAYVHSDCEDTWLVGLVREAVN
jgi:hypothetical protein